MTTTNNTATEELDVPVEFKPDLRRFNKAEEQVTKAVASLSAIKTIQNADDLATAMDILSRASKVDKVIEAKRVELVKPMNDAVKKINEFAKALTAKLPPAITAAKNVVLDYNKNQQILLEKRRLEVRTPQLIELGFTLVWGLYKYETLTVSEDTIKALVDNQWLSLITETTKRVSNLKAEKLQSLEKEQDLNNAFGTAQDVKETAEAIADVKSSIQVTSSGPGAFIPTGDVEKVKGITKRWTYKVIAENEIPREYMMIDTAKIRSAIANGTREIAGLSIFQEEGLTVR